MGLPALAEPVLPPVLEQTAMALVSDLTPLAQRASSVAPAVGLPASAEPVLPLVLGLTSMALASDL